MSAFRAECGQARFSLLLRGQDTGPCLKSSRHDLIQHSRSAWGMLQILRLVLRREFAGITVPYPGCDTRKPFKATSGKCQSRLGNTTVYVRYEDGRGRDLECKTEGREQNLFGSSLISASNHQVTSGE